MTEKNEFLSLWEAARLLGTSRNEIEKALEAYGLTSYVRDSTGKEFRIKRSDLAALKPLLQDSDSSAGVA